MKRTECIKVHVSEDEKKIIQEYAKTEGVCLSVFLRNQGLAPNMAFDPATFTEINEALNHIIMRHSDENTRDDIAKIYDLLGGTYNGNNENRQ